MIRALLLIFDPAGTWERIVQTRRDVLAILGSYLLPLLLLATSVEVYGMTQWGKPTGMFNQIAKVPLNVALHYGIGEMMLTLMMALVGAKLVKSTGETFHGRHTFTQAFRVVAYALGPLVLLRLFNAWPPMNPWFTWAVGIVLTLATLYHGLPRVMQPDPAHAFGLYFTSALLLTVISGLSQLVLWAVLKYQFTLMSLPLFRGS